MDECGLSSEFDQLKISAFNKLRKINSCINEVTIGPNCSRNLEKTKSQPKISVKKGTRKEFTSSTSENGMPFRNLLKDFEVKRQEGVKSAIQTRLNKLGEFSRKQKANKEQEWLKQQQAFIDDMHQKESSIFQAINEYDKNVCNEHAQLVQHYQDLAERRKIHLNEIQERSKQRQIINANIDSIKIHQQDFRTIYQQIIIIIKTCRNNEELKTLLGEDFKLLKLLPEQLEEVVTKLRNGKFGEDLVQEAAFVVNQVNLFKSKLEQYVEEINNKKDVDLVPDDSATVQLTPLVSTNSPLQYEEKDLINKTEKITGTSVNNVAQYVSLTNLKMYLEIMDFLEQHTASFKDLEGDSSLKKFKFDCKKAVNTPVNSLSGISSEHILDKYNRLHKLISGQDVFISDKRLNASSHPQGIAFCMDLLAKKFVLQGDLMVSSNPESAFCYATVIISLWNDFPLFGKLILAYFYKFCPYLVPYYIPRQVEETDEEFYTKQGYQYIDGQIEKQDKFLKRMTGTMRLYTAILIAKPKKGQTTTPHNLQHGWRWLASLLKLEPRVDITATMLHSFLETAGFEMDTRYSKVFKKVVRIIIEIYLPSCREKCTGGAVARLELLLNEYIKNRKFYQPNGYLPYSNW